MKRLEAITPISSVYGLIELRGCIADEPNGNSENQPVLVIEEIVGDLPSCFDSLLGKYRPQDIIEPVLRPEMAPNVNQTYPQPINYSPVHLRRPPETENEMKWDPLPTNPVFVRVSKQSGGYSEAVKKMFEHPNLT